MSDEPKGVVLDCQGLACPQPVIMTKKALEHDPEELTVIVDNLVAKENVAKFAVTHGYGVSIEQTDGIFQLHMVAKPRPFVPIPNPGTNLTKAGDLPVFLFTQNTLGQNSAELGAILMKSLFVSMLEMTPQPRAIMLLNTGVLLAVEGSPVLGSLQELFRRGVTVTSCGTCLDYFNLKQKLAVGSVTNMFSILTELKGPGPIITL